MAKWFSHTYTYIHFFSPRFFFPIGIITDDLSRIPHAIYIPHCLLKSLSFVILYSLWHYLCQGLHSTIIFVRVGATSVYSLLEHPNTGMRLYNQLLDKWMNNLGLGQFSVTSIVIWFQSKEMATTLSICMFDPFCCFLHQRSTYVWESFIIT